MAYMVPWEHACREIRNLCNSKLELGLEITTVSKCVIDCGYCPQKIFQEAYHGCRSLSLKDFKKVPSKVPKIVSIHFSAFARGAKKSSRN
jgi:biotin synthase-related radical SAM superfamily protein